MFYHIRIQCKKPEYMLMLHCSMVIRIICRKQHHNRTLFVNVSKRLPGKPAPRADSLAPIPFAMRNAHVVCGGYFHHGQSLLHPRREEGTARSHISWKHRVAGTVCSVGGDQLQHKANLRLLLIAIFEYHTVPSKHICNRCNIGIALWEIISINWNLLECTNSLFHSPQPPLSLLPSHTGTRMTSTLELSCLVTKHPPRRTTTALGSTAMPCCHSNWWRNSVQSLLKSPGESWRLCLLRSLFKWHGAVQRRHVWGKGLSLSPWVPIPKRWA